ncbi:MAG: DNA sulfur modification protein DndD [Verrucomicrobiales bacterium]|nr:DNA sulfur modification protein DndD [Verrucomicrobiales bacterium]
MILESLQIENFGVYGGIQEINLLPDGSEKPIVLVGGLNGGGKTTLLDALQLVLYGSRARLSNRGRMPYKSYLEGTIHRGADPGEGSSLRLRFRKTIDGKIHNYEVDRSWRVGARGIEETISVERNGDAAPELAEHWADFIEGILPNGIAHLFFFDAEQIKDLAEGENAKEMLRTAIYSLLGLDLVNRLESDLKVLERRKRDESGDSSAATKAQEADAEVERLYEELKKLTDQKGKSQKKADKLRKERDSKSKEFRQAGGELFEQREELKRSEKDILQKIHGEEEALRQLAAGPAPLLILQESLAELEHTLEDDAQTKQSRVLLESLAERDKELLADFSSWSKSKSIQDKLKDWLEEDISKRKETAGREIQLHADDLLVNSVRHLRSQGLLKAREDISRHLERLGRYREERDQIDRKLSRVPDDKVIAALQIEFKSVQQESEKIDQEVASLEARMEALGNRIEEAEKRADLANRRVAEVELDQEDTQRVLKYSQKTRDTLKEFRDRATRQHVEKIEGLMLESFRQLLRKQSLITSLRIDPVTFEVELRGADGNVLPFDRLSAGERQLLATSLLWGLARASGRPIPTVIDTPLGRLDSSHRKHLVERYFPVASHQVILLSTDEEIDETNLERLRPFVTRSYELYHDEELHSTSVREGYFWNHEATC